MAINSNHVVEDLNEVKCAVVEKNISADRASFLKGILEMNGYTVQIVASAPPKSKAATPVVEASETEVVTIPEPTSFTIGVTDLMFNSVNAVFGRLLKTKEGRVVTLAYWNQLESISHDEIPYFENKINL